MKIPFKSLLGTVPRDVRTVGEIVTAGVSVKKEERKNLSTSDRLKLAKSAREGGTEKFTFFESDGKVGGNICTVYDLHMPLKGLPKAIIFYDIDDVFKMFPSETVWELEGKLDLIFDAQSLITSSRDAFVADPNNPTIQANLLSCITTCDRARIDLENVSLAPVDHLKN